MAVLKGTDVSTTTAVTPELAALKAASRLAKRELYSPMTVLSRFRESAAWESIMGVLSMAAMLKSVSACPGTLEKKEVKLTWHAQQDKVPRSRIIHDLQLLEIPIHDLSQQSRLVTPPVRVADVIDPDPHANKRIRCRPGRIRGMRGNGAAELLDLVDEAENRGGIGCHEAGICGRAAVGKIIRQQGRGV